MYLLGPSSDVQSREAQRGHESVAMKTKASNDDDSIDTTNYYEEGMREFVTEYRARFGYDSDSSGFSIEKEPKKKKNESFDVEEEATSDDDSIQSSIQSSIDAAEEMHSMEESRPRFVFERDSSWSSVEKKQKTKKKQKKQRRQNYHPEFSSQGSFLDIHEFSSSDDDSSDSGDSSEDSATDIDENDDDSTDDEIMEASRRHADSDTDEMDSDDSSDSSDSGDSNTDIDENDEDEKEDIRRSGPSFDDSIDDEIMEAADSGDEATEIMDEIDPQRSTTRVSNELQNLADYNGAGSSETVPLRAKRSRKPIPRLQYDSLGGSVDALVFEDEEMAIVEVSHVQDEQVDSCIDEEEIDLHPPTTRVSNELRNIADHNAAGSSETVPLRAKRSRKPILRLQYGTLGGSVDALVLQAEEMAIVEVSHDQVEQVDSSDDETNSNSDEEIVPSNKDIDENDENENENENENEDIRRSRPLFDDSIDTNASNDRVDANASSDSIDTNASNDRVDANASSDSIDTNASNNNASNDRIDTNASNDNASNDRIDTNASNDNASNDNASNNNASNNNASTDRNGNLLDWKTFIMEGKGNQAARDLVKEYCRNILLKAERFNEIEDLNSKVRRHHLRPQRITDNAGIYFRRDKIGYTSHFKKRIHTDIEELAKENVEIGEKDYQLLMDFDNIDTPLNDVWEEEYLNVMRKMISTDAPISRGQRRFFEALLVHKGANLGGKRDIMLQMIEYALQKKHKFGAPAEFLMYDDLVEKRIYTQAETDAMKVIRAVGISEPYAASDEFFLWALCSWKTGASEDCHSSKIMTVRAALGKTHRDNWRDTIPVAAILNAVTADQIFCKAYSSEQRATGRDRMLELFEQLFSDPNRPGMVFADTNEVIFDEDPASEWDSIHEFIRHHWGDNLELALNLRDEIYVYKHKQNPHAILVHRPLCLASSSIEKVSMESRVKRGLTAAILCNVQRFGNGLEFLSPSVEWGNIVEAMIAFQIYLNGLHGGHRQSAAMFRHFCRLDNSETPLTTNRLGKIEGPVPMSLRSWRLERSLEAIRTTGDDYRVVPRTRRFICNHPDLDDWCENEDDTREVFDPIFDQVIERLRHQTDNPELIRTRLLSLMTHFRDDSFFRRLFDEWWKNYRQNSGNAHAHGTSSSQIATNNDACDDWIARFAPKDPTDKNESGPSFWIKMGNSKLDLQHIEDAMDQDNSWNLIEGEKFPGTCTEIFDGNLVHSSFVGRLKNRKLQGQTGHTRATKHTAYGLEQELCVGTPDGVNFYTRVHMTFKNLSKVRNKHSRGSDSNNDGSDRNHSRPSKRIRRSNPTSNQSSGYDTDQWSENEFEWEPSNPENITNQSSGYDTDQWSENEFEWEPSNDDSNDDDDEVSESTPGQQSDLTPTAQEYLLALQRYTDLNNGKFPTKRHKTVGSAVNWAQTNKWLYKTNKLADDHPVVVALKRMGFMDYDPSSHTTSGNKYYTTEAKNASWNRHYLRLKRFLAQPELGGLAALRQYDKTLNNWVDTNRLLFQKKSWVNDEDVNKARYQMLAELKVYT